MKLENTDKSVETDGNGRQVTTYGGYSYVFDYDEYDTREGENEKTRTYGMLLAMIAVFTVSVLCVAVVIITDIVKGSSYKDSSPIGAITDSGTPFGSLTRDEIASKTGTFTVSICVKNGDGEENGTGIVITSDGYIVTGNTLLENTEIVEVCFDGGKIYTASVCGRDTVNDIALLKVEAEGLTSANINTDSSIGEGDSVMGIAASVGERKPFIISGTVSSICDEVISVNDDGQKLFCKVIKTSFSPNAELSGAVLTDMRGNVVGIMSDICGNGQTALPVSSLLPIVKGMMNGYSEAISTEYRDNEAWGVHGKTVTAEMSEKYNLPRGVFVKYFESNSLLKKAGVKKNDIIVVLDSVNVDSVESFNTLCGKAVKGAKVGVTVYRNGHYYQLTFVNETE